MGRVNSGLGCERRARWRAAARSDAPALRAVLRQLREGDHRVQVLLAEVQALVQRTEQLERLASTDPLTGLHNRRGLEEELAREEARARRYGIPAAVALLDVNRLKTINDDHGHPAGDAVLQAVATALRHTARAADVVARVGGDEFAVLLLGAGNAGAALFLERVRALTLCAQLPDETQLRVGLAVGAATREEAGSLAVALTLADDRLRADKRRNAP